MSEADPPQQRRASPDFGDAHASGVQESERRLASGGSVGSLAVVSFDRRELREIMDLYGRMVAAGEWRDYALDFSPDQAVFSVFRRTSETPLYRIKKHPKLARRLGAYSVVAIGGRVMKGGHDLGRVLGVLEPRRVLALV